MSVETVCYFRVWLDKRGIHPKYLFDVRGLSEREAGAHFIWSDRAAGELQPSRLRKGQTKAATE